MTLLLIPTLWSVSRVHLTICNSSAPSLGFLPEGVHSSPVWAVHFPHHLRTTCAVGRQDWHPATVYTLFSALLCTLLLWGPCCLLDHSSSLLSLLIHWISGSLSSSLLPSFAIICFDISIHVSYPPGSLLSQFLDLLTFNDAFLYSILAANSPSHILDLAIGENTKFSSSLSDLLWSPKFPSTPTCRFHRNLQSLALSFLSVSHVLSSLLFLYSLDSITSVLIFSRFLLLSPPFLHLSPLSSDFCLITSMKLPSQENQQPPWCYAYLNIWLVDFNFKLF